MTWEIVVGIIALASFIITIGKIVSNNTKALTELQCTLGSLKETITKDEKELSNIDKKVNEHEVRIVQLEAK